MNPILTFLCLVLLLGCTPPVKPSSGTPGVPEVDADRQGSAALDTVVGGEDSEPPVVPVDAELEAWRIGLLREAFDVASLIPIDPHAKDRARCQAEVVIAMIDLGLPVTAAELTRGVDNWRRAELMAMLAADAARNGCDEEVVREMIRQSDRNHPADLIQWRHDRIDGHLARALARLGDDEGAIRLEAGFGPAVQGVVVQEKADTIARERVDELLARLDPVVERGDLDQLLSVIRILQVVHARFHEDGPLRAEIERRIDEAAVNGKIPHDLRIRFTLELVDTAVERGDLEHGVMLAGRARKIFDSVQSRTPFPPEFEVELLGEIALRNAMVGQDLKAGATIDESLGRFEAERRRIADVFQAKSLRPVLEAAIAAGDAERIERLLELTIAAGATNPNARPRAEDLVATMVLLAQVDHEPAEDVFARIREIRGGLVAPW